MRSLLVVLALAASATADPKDEARQAIWLAQHGQCDEALAYAGAVGQSDPELYARALVTQSDLIGCMLQSHPLGTPTTITPTRTCKSGVYAHPSLFVGGAHGSVLHRVAAGFVFRNCTDDDVDRTNAYLGGTLAFGGRD